jgi:acyl carrier protein
MSSDLPSRLAGCFSAIFPDLSPADIARASISNVPAWDSVATVTLVAVIEEEFGVGVEADDIAQMVSFEDVCRYLTARVR